MPNPVTARLTNAATIGATAHTSGNVMTRSGTAAKAMLLLALCAFAATLSWRELASGSVSFYKEALAYGLGGGTIVALIVTFRPRTAPWLSPIYAVLEGMALGGVSWLVDQKYPGIAQQAVMLTFFVAMTVFLLYRTQILQATSRFRRTVVSAGLAILAFHFLELIMPAFGLSLGFSGSGGWLAMAVNVAIAGVAALFLVLDFDQIDRGVAAGAPKAMEWYGAFSLMLTLVWLYLEILRLLGAGEE